MDRTAAIRRRHPSSYNHVHANSILWRRPSKQVSRKTRGALSSSAGGVRGDRKGGSQFAADRRPAVSHIMVACLTAGGGAPTLGRGSGSVAAVASVLSAAAVSAGRQSEEVKQNSLSQAAATGGSSMAPSNNRGGQGCQSVGGRDFCVAVSGGLASVLELVQPLRRVGWAGRDTGSTISMAPELYGAWKKREILRLVRVPSTWRRAGAATPLEGVFEEQKNADDAHNDPTTASSAAEAAVDDIDGEAEEFVVMCEDGWFGWYQSHHRRFEVT